MTSVSEALAGVTRLGLDTSPFIYYIEAHPQYDKMVSEVFTKIRDGELTAYTSVITLTEVLVHPMGAQQDQLTHMYTELLNRSANLIVLPIDSTVATLAATFRAHDGFRTPDALQLAAAQLAGCEAFLTNDQKLKRLVG